jgi:hypothetical protein
LCGKETADGVYWVLTPDGHNFAQALFFCNKLFFDRGNIFVVSLFGILDNLDDAVSRSGVMERIGMPIDFFSFSDRFSPCIKRGATTLANAEGVFV